MLYQSLKTLTKYFFKKKLKYLVDDCFFFTFAA